MVSSGASVHFFSFVPNCVVLVGTPGQKTTLGLDTGSSSTWVNPECATSGSSGSVAFCESISQFNWQASTTLKNEGLPMTLAYGVGEANGTFVTDVFTVGSRLSFPPLLLHMLTRLQYRRQNYQPGNRYLRQVGRFGYRSHSCWAI